jgi:hypothetical protein
MKERKIKLKLHTGTWKGDDVDITPTFKLCTDSKMNESETVKITLTYLALCWLKWALIIQFSTQHNYEKDI